MHLQLSFELAFLFLRAVPAAVIQQQPLGTDRSFTLDLSSALQELNKTVGGRLIDVAPIGKPCYSPVSDECARVTANKRGDIWTTNQPGGYFYSNWASCQATDETCTIPLDNTTTVPPEWVCHSGSVPPLMINLTNTRTMVSDVRAAFDFALKTRTPLVIKNTGHDWKGRSTAPNSLAIWTHALKHPHVPIVKDTNFTPTGCLGCPGETVFHYGPGQQWGDAYAEAEKHNLTVVGGSCPSVGIAGWLQGGGHSPLTPRHGMGADNLREIEILTPTGDLLVANEWQNSDIFFAVRGGGGGTWGFITRITYKAIKSFEVVDFHVGTMLNLAREDIEEYFDIFTSNAVAWSKKGWGGYVKSAATGPSFELVNSHISLSEAKEDMRDVIEFLESRGYRNLPRQEKAYSFKTHSSWNKFAKEVYSPPAMHLAYGSMNPISRLLLADAFTGPSKERLNDALMRLYDNGLGAWLMFVTPTNYNHTESSALHPSWKDAIMSVRANTVWNQFSDVNSSIPARTHQELLHHAFEGIRQLGPGMGVSVSEADIWEKDHHQRFWGQERYNDLMDVKAVVDPYNILSNWHAVNWNPLDTRYKCYPRPNSL